MNVFSAVFIFLIRLCFCPLGCSYLFEVQNEVHNNSSLEIYYQVHLHVNGVPFEGWGDRRQETGQGYKATFPPPFCFTQSVFSVLKSPVLNVNVMQVYCIWYVSFPICPWWFPHQPTPSVSLYMCFLLPDKVDCDGTKGCILTTHPNEGNEDSYFISVFSVTCKPPKVMYFWSCSVRSSVNHVLTLLELKSS